MSTPEERNELASIIHKAASGRGQKLYFSARYAVVNAILDSCWLAKRESRAKAQALRQFASGLRQHGDDDVTDVLAVIADELDVTARMIEAIYDVAD